MTSVKDDATPEQIEAQVQQAIKRGGKKVAVVLLCDADRQVTQAWAVVEGVAAVTDTTPYLLTADQLASTNTAASSPATEAQPVETVVENEEGEMAAKKSEAKKSVKGKKAKAARNPKTVGEVRKGSKTEIVAKLLKRANGCTAADALKAGGWKVIDVSYMEKVMGVKIKKEKIKGKITRYYAK